jgi:acyl-CoA synthetase (NDP forming)
VDIRGDADSDKFRLAIQTLLSAEEINGVIALLAPRARLDISAFAKATYWAKKESNKPILASFVGEEAVSEGLDILNKHKIPHLPTPERAAACMSALVKYQQWLMKKITKPKLYHGNKEKVKEILNHAISQKHYNLYPHEAISIASNFGFIVPKTELATSPKEAVLSANKIGYPVVLKISSSQIIHKTDMNLIKYPISTDEEVYYWYEKIWAIGSKYADGIIVQEMVKGGTEVIIGMKYEPLFGPLIMFGLGGIWVEVLKDVAFRIAPFSKQEAKEMLKEIKAYPILKGIRGKKGVDIDSIIDALLKVSSLAINFPKISQIDINPLIVHEQGAVAVDVKMIIHKLEH